MKTKTRLELTMSPADMIVALAEGNPGAMTVMLRMVNNNEKIDPMDWAGPFGPLLSLDALGIFGCRIWMLYKDVCKENLVHTLALMRSVQMGITRDTDLQHAIDNRGDGIDLLDTLKKLAIDLPQFNFDFKES